MNEFALKDYHGPKIEITPAALLDDIAKCSQELDNLHEGSGVSATDLLNRQIESIPCLVEPFLQKVGLACIAGSSDTGKSSFLRYLCMCLVAGRQDFLGFPIHAEHKRAVYISTEDDETAIAFLLNRQNRDMCMNTSSFNGLRFIFDTENLLQVLDGSLTKAPADIVCIDAFTDLYGRSMNESNQIRAFLNDYAQLSQRHQCLVLFLHHCGKRTEELAPSKHNLLGSQALEAKMRLVIELRNDITDPSMRHLCVVKGNYLPMSAKNESYQLCFTENMTFRNTGERAPIESLAKADDGGRRKYEQIKELQAQGLSTREIAQIVGYRSSGSVTKMIQKFEKPNSVS